MHTGLMQTLRWMRIPGDTLFALGTLVLAWSVAGLFRVERGQRPNAVSGVPASHG